MSGFYKMDPADWDFGTASLSLEEEAAYLRIVNAIHKHDGPVPNIDRVLAGMFRCSTRKARALVDALAAAGKIVVEGDVIWNERARSDLVQRGFTSISRAEAGAKGGRKRAENAAKALEDNEPPQASASSRIEENRIEHKDREAIASPKQKRACSLPAGWVPSEKNREDAHLKDFTDQEIDHEADKFRNYHHSKGTRFKDWDAGWRTWLTNAREFRGRSVAFPAGSGRHGQGGSIASIVAGRRVAGPMVN